MQYLNIRDDLRPERKDSGVEALVDIKPDLGGLSVGAAWGAKTLRKDALRLYRRGRRQSGCQGCDILPPGLWQRADSPADCQNEISPRALDQVLTYWTWREPQAFPFISVSSLVYKNTASVWSGEMAQ